MRCSSVAILQASQAKAKAKAKAKSPAKGRAAARLARAYKINITQENTTAQVSAQKG